MARLSKDDAELQQREAQGLWQAQIMAKDIAESDEKITLDVLLRLHKVFQETANPNIAGRFRKNGEDIEPLACITPIPGRLVQEEIYKFWREFDVRSAVIPKKNPTSKTGKYKRNKQVIELAAWTQHQIAKIHPFCEGNGRMARLMTNLVLRRYGILPTDIKYEGENKEKYLQALCDVDLKNDDRMLIQLIIKGINNSYRKLIQLKKKQK